MKFICNLFRGIGVLSKLIAWVMLYCMYMVNVFTMFNLKYIYKQLRLIYVCNYHHIYDPTVYKLWWDALTQTSNAEKVYLTYGEFSTGCYLNMHNSIFGYTNAKFNDVQSVVSSVKTTLSEYYIKDGNEYNLKMRYLYSIIDNKVHLLENNMSNVKSIKNMIDYFGRDLYKRSINITT